EEVRALEREYDRFLEELDVLGAGLSEQDRVILRVARLFGECELTMPPDFVAEVKRYIHEWRLSPRLERAIERMHAQSLTPLVVEAMLEQHLPPQFLYLALQESSFDNDAVGPKTRFGIAKGIWQFIPSTARRYGLRTGPLVELPVADPNDDRHAPELATRAAARYLRDIYSRDAQASGLLVMASYNWGPNNIRRRIREMPANPRERNFWALLKKDEVPRETYDYVFHIVAAAVIGEAPELFGFDFENPLRDVVETLADGT
ncbi:MAG TPA: lytic transglycosylase domain-containing protein, partial [Myxococcota bacterium]|nr:lytic transglycosylase domain-containing protein [Myxococcota bacterium]